MPLLLLALSLLLSTLWGLEHCRVSYDGIAGHLGLLECKNLNTDSTYRIVLKDKNFERSFTYVHPERFDYLPFAVPRWWGGNITFTLYRDGLKLASVRLKVKPLKVRDSRISFGKNRSPAGSNKTPSQKGGVKGYYLVRRLMRTYTPVRYYEKRAIFPLEGFKYITTPYGAKRYINGVYRGFHKGVDLAAPRGTPVLATLSGRVIFAGYLPLTGNTVIIDHGWGLISLYAHLSEVSVKKGVLVRRGEVIGKVGSSGRSTGPHLHFGVYLNDTTFDPLEFLKLRLRP